MNSLPEGLLLVDGHVHQWDPFTTPREVSLPAKLIRAVPPLGKVVPRLVPRADREFVGDPQFVLRRYLPPDYAMDALPLTVESVVHVEAGWHDSGALSSVDETRWVADLPFEGRPRLGAIVCHADPCDAEIDAVLDAHLAASPLVRGVRCMAAHHPDPGVRSWTDNEHLLTDATFLRGFAALVERGLSFEVWVYSHQLQDVVRLAREYPEAVLVLDHYATPVGLFGPRGRETGHSEAGRRAIFDRWHEGLLAVAELPNVVAKHSGLGMSILGWPSPVASDDGSRSAAVDRMGPVVSALQDAFGADRTLWSSNFPMDKPILGLATSVELLLEILGPNAEPQRLFRYNAQRVYRIETNDESSS